MENIIKEGRTRREFLKGAGAVVAGGVVVGVVGSQLSCEEVPGTVNWWTPGSAPLTLAPLAEGYLVHDTRKCASCLNCMMACATVHEGVSNLSLSRRQVFANIYESWPNDINIMDCRQCVYPACIEACPSGAFHANPDNGNVRTIDEGTCADYQASIAPDVCRLCIEACPYVPSIAVWKPVDGQGIEGVAMVCDLCYDAPYWSEEGGVDGKQACVEVCPMKAIRMVKEVPSQMDEEGYNVDLRAGHFMDLVTLSAAGVVAKGL